jgi:hypothetical protein
LVCYGECDSIVVLDGSSLEVVAIFDIGNWILALSLYRAEKKDVDTLIFVDAEGIIHKRKLDMQLLECKNENLVYQLDNHSFSKFTDLQFNPFDPKLFFVLERDFCEIIHEEFYLVTRILKESPSDPNYQGAKFLSARTILIWNESGMSSFYYLGLSSDIKRTKCSQLNPRSIILLSDKSTAMYIDRLDIGPYPHYKYKEHF